uniref:CLIP domain-containing serine protease n=1 Tax=Culex pipiens TaxID=7175 RepID=A0A8D8EX21_CULPI
MSFVFIKAVVLLTTLLAVHAKQCPSEQDLCVPVQYCAPIYEAIMSDRAQRNATLQEYIWSRTCHTVGVDHEPRVCCNRIEVPLGKRCSGASGTPGRCVGPERCELIAKYLERDRRSAAIERTLAENVCFRDGDKDFYCCPEAMVIEANTAPLPMNLVLPPPSTLKIGNAFPSCKDPTGSKGRCVPVRNCDAIHSAFLNERITQDRKMADFVRASSCPSDARDGHSICCATGKPTKKVDFIAHSKAARLGLKHCGTVRLADNILLGSATGLGQFPWMANLMYKRKGALKSLCSGSLIHPRYVLTAAHCMKGNTRPVAVRLGEYDLSSDPDCVDGWCAAKVKEYPIEKLIPNNNFNGFDANYDIALIRLARKVVLVDGEVFPVCLPLTESLMMLKPNRLTVTGWGQTEDQRASNVLLEADLQVVPRTDLCQGESTFCARGRDMAGHCRGDSGGPYQTVVPVGDGSHRFVQFGVVSGGPAGCSVNENRPGVGVMVSYHINWILDNLEN